MCADCDARICICDAPRLNVPQLVYVSQLLIAHGAQYSFSANKSDSTCYLRGRRHTVDRRVPSSIECEGVFDGNAHAGRGDVAADARGLFAHGLVCMAERAQKHVHMCVRVCCKLVARVYRALTANCASGARWCGMCSGRMQ